MGGRGGKKDTARREGHGISDRSGLMMSGVLGVPEAQQVHGSTAL